MKSHLFQFTWKQAGTPREQDASVVSLLAALKLDANEAPILRHVPAPVNVSRSAKEKPTGSFSCGECEKSFSTERGLKNHRHTVHVLKLYTKNVDPLPCPTCERSFSSNYDLWQHYTNIHKSISLAEMDTVKKLNPSVDTRQDQETEEYEYVPCSICGQAVLNHEHGMNLHYETLKPIMGLDMCCPLCDSTFTEQRALFQHFRFCREKQKGIKPVDIHQSKLAIDSNN